MSTVGRAAGALALAVGTLAGAGAAVAQEDTTRQNTAQEDTAQEDTVQEDTVAYPPLDLPALLLQQLPPGYTQLPDRPGSLGPLDAAAAAAVLDQSGRIEAEVLTKAGFQAGYSRAWSKQDTQDVVVDVLLAFATDGQARTFTRGFLLGRRQTTKAFDIPGTPAAAGFERGPATPSRKTPSQREIIIQHGRVLAIVVLAGFAGYPSAEAAVALADAQRATLAAVPLTPDPERRDSDDQGTSMTNAALLLLTAVAGWMVSLLHQYPLVGAKPRW